MKLKSEIIDLIQKKIGVKDEEIFKVTYESGDTWGYYFKLFRLYTSLADKETDDWKLIIDEFENLKIEIPSVFRPKFQEVYFYVSLKRKPEDLCSSDSFTNYNYVIECSSFFEGTFDLMNLKIGNCFRNKDEAFNNRFKIRDILLNKENI